MPLGRPSRAPRMLRHSRRVLPAGVGAGLDDRPAGRRQSPPTCWDAANCWTGCPGSVLNAVDRLHAQRIRQANLTSEARAQRRTTPRSPRPQAEQAKANGGPGRCRCRSGAGRRPERNWLCCRAGSNSSRERLRAAALAAVDGLQQQREQFQRVARPEAGGRRGRPRLPEKRPGRRRRRRPGRRPSGQLPRRRPATERAAAEQAARQAARRGRGRWPSGRLPESRTDRRNEGTPLVPHTSARRRNWVYATCDAAREPLTATRRLDEPGYRRAGRMAMASPAGPAKPPASAAPARAPVPGQPDAPPTRGSEVVGRRPQMAWARRLRLGRWKRVRPHARYSRWRGRRKVRRLQEDRFDCSG